MSVIRMTFCGDTMLPSTEAAENPFEGIAPLTTSSDLCFCNLESPLSETGQRRFKRHVITSYPANARHLVRSGFNVVNIANNHILDLGMVGARNTIRTLSENGIHVLGLETGKKSTPVVIEKGGIKVGLLAYADYGFRELLMPLRERAALQDVALLKKTVDIVVVSLHWGFEYVDFPSPSQQALARRLIDSGASCVIGHHPHVFQGMELYGDGIIAYSLGNSLFDLGPDHPYRQMDSGLLLHMRVAKKGIVDYDFIPVHTTDDFRVRSSSGEEMQRLRNRFSALSSPLQDRTLHKIFWLNEASKVYMPLQLDAWRFRLKRRSIAELVSLMRWCCEPLISQMLAVFFARRASFLISRHVCGTTRSPIE
jgi:poly-gamma-glutamate capsule biosynthesis protein CapA/YwtB (metallophosphatase superfamily)